MITNTERIKKSVFLKRERRLFLWMNFSSNVPVSIQELERDQDSKKDKQVVDAVSWVHERLMVDSQDIDAYQST